MERAFCHGSGLFILDVCVPDESKPMCGKCATAIDTLQHNEKEPSFMKKTTALLLLCCLIIAALPVAAAEKGPFSFTDGWGYKILEDGTAKIISCPQISEENIAIPEILDGIQVTAIDEGIFTCYGYHTLTIPDCIVHMDGNPFNPSWGEIGDIVISPDHPVFRMINGALISKPDSRLICALETATNGVYEIPQGVRIIGKNAFYGHDGMTGILLPDSLEEIQECAFAYCSFEEAVIPHSVKAIGSKAFYGSDLAVIRFEGHIEKMGDNPFVGCDNIREIILADNDPYLEIKGGVLFSKPDHRLIRYPTSSGARSYDVPNGTQIIGGWAFERCENLMRVKIPDGAVSIGEKAFDMCERLGKVILPDTLKTIGDRAFLCCYTLEGRLTIPDSVEETGQGAFLFRPPTFEYGPGSYEKYDTFFYPEPYEWLLMTIEAVLSVHVVCGFITMFITRKKHIRGGASWGLLLGIAGIAAVLIRMRKRKMEIPNTAPVQAA